MKITEKIQSDRFSNYFNLCKITGRSSNPIKYHKKNEGMKFKKI